MSVSNAAWLAGRQVFYAATAAGKSEVRASAEAMIEEYETMHGRFGTATEREAAVLQAVSALEKRRGGQSWTL